MQAAGLQPDQITQVRGFADQRLRKADAPLDLSNRRTSLIVRYGQKPAENVPVTLRGEASTHAQGVSAAKAPGTGKQPSAGGQTKLDKE
jgi:chemotaxis protein MotB